MIQTATLNSRSEMTKYDLWTSNFVQENMIQNDHKLLKIVVNLSWLTLHSNNMSGVTQFYKQA